MYYLSLNADFSDSLLAFQNRGIGLGICQKLLSQASPPITLYACSRKGLDLGLSTSNNNAIHYPSLDITSTSSIKTLADSISSQHGYVSILINNAGITDLSTSFSAADVMSVNYTGTKTMCQTFLPLLSKHPGSRIVNLASTASSLSAYSPRLQSAFRDPSLTLPQLDKLADSFLSASKAGEAELKEEGWGNTNAYPPSKACVNALTAILARENEGVIVNSCCPGWVDTEMGGAMGRAPKTAKEGARIPVRLAVGDLGGVSGRYWGNDSVMEKGEGKVQSW